MLKEAIKKLVAGIDLTREESSFAMDEIMNGNATPSQIAAFITALSIKKETAEEITGCSESMRSHSIKIFPQAKDLVDTCGTGGDSSGTFNISTAAAIVAAGAGVSVAKHGNRSVSSRSGSADVLEVLGVKVDIDPKKVEACINQAGIGFIYAPSFHKAMRFAAPTRKEIGIRTIFNILGPLTNPAAASSQLLGVYKRELAYVMAEVLKKLGTVHAMVVCSHDGLDEISISAKTRVAHLKDGKIKEYDIKPQDFGIKIASKNEILGSSPNENAEIILSIIREKEKGPKRDVVVLNAGAAIFVGGKAADIKQGIKMAEASIDSGMAQKKLQALIDLTQGE
ncbi:MAG: anthranilate phosphoribosyltransferase [Candidatus Margulisiibacteriota bacterium]